MIDEDSFSEEYQRFIYRCLEEDAAKRPDIETLMNEFGFFETADDLKELWFKEYQDRLEQYERVEQNPFSSNDQLVDDHAEQSEWTSVCLHVIFGIEIKSTHLLDQVIAFYQTVQQEMWMSTIG